MRLRYTTAALADLNAVLDYIAEQSPQGAQRVQSRIRAVLDLLLTYPLIGTRTDDPTIRRLTTSPYPYLIVYEVTGTEIIVHAVRPAAREHPVCQVPQEQPMTTSPVDAVVGVFIP